MGQAGKDGEPLASAIKSDSESDSMPVRALVRVAPQSARLATEHALLASSVWCGMVFSVALVITVLNVLPPVPVGYRVSTQVLASPKRLDTLQRQLASHLSASTDVDTQLLGVEVLDARSHAVAAHLDPDKEPLTLVEVRSLWPSRTTTSQVHHWLSELTKSDAQTVRHFDSASAERFARWELQARQHYLKQFRQTHTASKPASDDDTGTLASSHEKAPTRFASLNLDSPAKVGGLPTPSEVDVEALLVRDVELAGQREATAAQSVAQQAAKVSGVLTLSGSPHVRAYPGRVPTALVMSVLVLALAGGTIGGWAHHRAQSGGIFYATDVASNMRMMGLPILGQVRLPGGGRPGSESRLRQQIARTRRWLLQQSLAASELVVMFWCLAIAIRMVLDPLWRAMLWDNPLAALGRLFLGLP